MDFIEALPRSQLYTCILVIVDLFTKYANFLPLKHPYTTLSVARLFHDQVYKHHGLPQSIVSDRDRVFLSHLWKELFRLADVQLQMSTAYHPQSDG
jgi:transposase InsO family protein